MIFNSKGQVLLIKHSYQDKYYFPGGGVHKGEQIIAAGHRELKEETNLHVKSFQFLGVYRYFEEKKDDTIIILFSKEMMNETELKVDNVEIIEANWFDLDKLPENISDGTQNRIKEYLNGNYPYVGSYVGYNVN